MRIGYPKQGVDGCMVAFDEMTGGEGGLRAAYGELDRWLKEAPPEMLALRRSQAELFFRRIGITFAVYGDEESTERRVASSWSG